MTPEEYVHSVRNTIQSGMANVMRVNPDTGKLELLNPEPSAEQIVALHTRKDEPQVE